MSLLEILVIWFSFDIVVFATGWYAVKAIKPNFPHWWRKNIADYGPKLRSRGLRLSNQSKITYRSGQI